jgi:hypothetical protein
MNDLLVDGVKAISKQEMMMNTKKLNREYQIHKFRLSD